MNVFKRFWFAITYGPELEKLCQERRAEEEARIHEENRHRLHLCYKHRQEPNHSHYSEHNCHYCQVLHQLTPHGHRGE